MGKKTANSTGMHQSPAAKVKANKQNGGEESDGGSDRGSEERPINNKELRLIRQECREVAGRLKQFTGKAADGSLAGHRLKVKEICEDHGWVDGPGFYYVTRYSVTEEVWSDVKDLLEGERFDRTSYEGHFKRAARVWEALKVLYSNLITKGSCAYGKACKFGHDLKSFPCRRLSQYGTCSYGDKCKFKHDKEAKPNNAGVCYEFNKNGKCSRNNCKFSHVTEEKKEVTNAVMDDSEDSEDGIFMMTVNEPKKEKKTLTLEVQIQEMKQKALVNTGSTVNLMSVEKMKELQLCLKKEDKTLRLADRRKLELVGSTTTTVRVSGVQCGREKKMTFFIAESLARPIILGLEGLQELEVQINLRQGYEPCIISVDDDSRKEWLGSVEDQPLDGLVCGVSLDSISYNEKTLDTPSTTGVGEEIGGDEAEKMNDECEEMMEEEEPAVKKEGKEEQLKFSDEMPMTKEGKRYILQLPWRNEDRLWETRRNESIDGDDSNMEAISAGIEHLIDAPEESLISDMFKKQMDERQLKYRAYAEFWEAMKDIQQEMLHKRRAYRRSTEPFAVRDEVLVFRPYSGKGAGLKYHIQFVGPFTIKEVLSPSVRLLDTQSHGGWGGRDIIPKQLVHNLVRYGIFLPKARIFLRGSTFSFR